jgi:hypothetical protein
MSDHWNTIEDALTEAQYDAQRHVSIYGDSDGALARIDAALAYVREQRAQVQPLDFPDGPGWWAFEDDRDKFIAHLAIFRRTNGEIEFKFDNSSKDTVSEDSFRAMYPGKWYKLQTPWEQRPQPKEGAA